MRSYFDPRELSLLQMHILKPIVFICLFSLLLNSGRLQAQDSLPHFTLTERNGMVIIGWINPYPELTQLIVQRSADSINGFRSIVSMPDPTSISNGFVDKKPGASNNYYRIYYVNPGGRYVFTASKKIFTNNTTGQDGYNHSNGSDASAVESTAKTILDKAIKIKRETGNGLELVGKLDSIVSQNVFTPSGLIFTNNEGDLIIALPDAMKRKFSLHVYKEDGTPLFKMKNIKEAQLLIDRSNFYHSGWFKYDLYDGERLSEQNKFFIPPGLR